MVTLLLGALLLAGFALAQAGSERLPARARALPLAGYALVLAFLGMEWARHDHGRPEWLLGIGFVGAPLVVIFGGALGGARRWYGWPDLGPAPGRLAAVAAALLVGVLLGSRAKAADVATSRARGEAIASSLRAWRDAHGGRWPTTLEEGAPSAPRTAMGLLAPPSFRYDPAGPRLAFPVSSDRELVLDVASPGAWTAR